MLFFWRAVVIIKGCDKGQRSGVVRCDVICDISGIRQGGSVVLRDVMCDIRNIKSFAGTGDMRYAEGSFLDRAVVIV